MSSKTDIINLGLAYAGQADIADITEAGAEASLTRRIYDPVRQQMLEAGPWSFAGKRVTLAALTTVDSDEWTYAHRMPSDCIRARFIEPVSAGAVSAIYIDGLAERQQRYEIRDGVLYSDLETVKLVYTWNLTETVRFTPHFVEAFAWQLAERFAIALVRDENLQRYCDNRAQRAISKALSHDSTNAPIVYSGEASSAVQARQ